MEIVARIGLKVSKDIFTFGFHLKEIWQVNALDYLLKLDVFKFKGRRRRRNKLQDNDILFIVYYGLVKIAEQQFFSNKNFTITPIASCFRIFFI